MRCVVTCGPRTPPSQSIRSGACSRTGRSSRESDHFASRAFFGCQTGLFLAKRLGNNSSGRRRSVYFRPSCSHHFVVRQAAKITNLEHLGVGCGAQIGYKPLHIRIGKSGMMACDVLEPASEASRGAVSSTRLDCENPCHRRLSLRDDNFYPTTNALGRFALLKPNRPEQFMDMAGFYPRYSEVADRRVGIHRWSDNDQDHDLSGQGLICDGSSR